MLFIGILTSCNEKKTNDDKSEITTLSVSNASYDFGEITSIDSAKHDFYLYNDGNNSLIIKDVKAGCGCTVPNWSNLPVKPGDSAKISVVFKPNESNVGIIKKSIVVQANTDSIFHVLYISGAVVKK